MKIKVILEDLQDEELSSSHDLYNEFANSDEESPGNVRIAIFEIANNIDPSDFAKARLFDDGWGNSDDIIVLVCKLNEETGKWIEYDSF